MVMMITVTANSNSNQVANSNPTADDSATSFNASEERDTFMLPPGNGVGFDNAWTSDNIDEYTRRYMKKMEEDQNARKGGGGAARGGGNSAGSGGGNSAGSGTGGGAVTSTNGSSSRKESGKSSKSKKSKKQPLEVSHTSFTTGFTEATEMESPGADGLDDAHSVVSRSSASVDPIRVPLSKDEESAFKEGADGFVKSFDSLDLDMDDDPFDQDSRDSWSRTVTVNKDTSTRSEITIDSSLEYAPTASGTSHNNQGPSSSGVPFSRQQQMVVSRSLSKRGSFRQPSFRAIEEEPSREYSESESSGRQMVKSSSASTSRGSSISNQSSTITTSSASMMRDSCLSPGVALTQPPSYATYKVQLSASPSDSKVPLVPGPGAPKLMITQEPPPEPRVSPIREDQQHVEEALVETGKRSKRSKEKKPKKERSGSKSMSKSRSLSPSSSKKKKVRSKSPSTKKKKKSEKEHRPREVKDSPDTHTRSKSLSPETEKPEYKEAAALFGPRSAQMHKQSSMSALPTTTDPEEGGPTRPKDPHTRSPSIHSLFEWSHDAKSRGSAPRTKSAKGSRVNADDPPGGETKVVRSAGRQSAASRARSLTPSRARRGTLTRSMSTTDIQQYSLTPKWPARRFTNANFHAQFYHQNQQESLSAPLTPQPYSPSTATASLTTHSAGSSTPVVTPQQMLQIIEPCTMREVLTFQGFSQGFAPPAERCTNYSDILDNQSMSNFSK